MTARRRIRVPFLMYHELGLATSDPYCLPADEFRRQMDHLRDHAIRAIDIGTYLAAVPAPTPSVVLTFDDGYASDFEVAYPWLRERGLHATFFITTARVNQPGHLTWGQLREMAVAGMGIGSHGVTHRYLTSLTPGEARAELTDSRARLEQELGCPVTLLALPGGRWASWLLPLAREVGYEGVCTSSVGLNDPGCDRYLFKRLALRRRRARRFAALVAQRRGALACERVGAFLRAAAREALGDSSYDSLRRRLLRGAS